MPKLLFPLILTGLFFLSLASEKAMAEGEYRFTAGKCGWLEYKVKNKECTDHKAQKPDTNSDLICCRASTVDDLDEAAPSSSAI